MQHHLQDKWNGQTKTLSLNQTQLRHRLSKCDLTIPFILM